MNLVERDQIIHTYITDTFHFNQSYLIFSSSHSILGGGTSGEMLKLDPAANLTVHAAPVSYYGGE